MNINTEDFMSNAPDTLDFAIDDFYASPSKESAERLARVSSQYAEDDRISEVEASEINAIAWIFLEEIA